MEAISVKIAPSCCLWCITVQIKLKATIQLPTVSWVLPWIHNVEEPTPRVLFVTRTGRVPVLVTPQSPQIRHAKLNEGSTLKSIVMLITEDRLNRAVNHSKANNDGRLRDWWKSNTTERQSGLIMPSRSIPAIAGYGWWRHFMMFPSLRFKQKYEYGYNQKQPNTEVGIGELGGKGRLLILACWGRWLPVKYRQVVWLST